jgi:hypothetical protein
LKLEGITELSPDIVGVDRSHPANKKQQKVAINPFFINDLLKNNIFILPPTCKIIL